LPITENVNLVKESLTQDIILSQYIDDCVDSLKAVFSGVKIIEKGKNFIIFENSYNGILAKQMIYVYILNKEKISYVLTFTAASEDFDKLRKGTFKAIEKSLVLK
jgi:hypothetical protein